MILRYQEKDNYIIDLLSDYAIKLGFAHQSGLNLNYEISGKIPNVNEVIPDPKLGLNFKILEADNRRINKVLVSRGENLIEK